MKKIKATPPELIWYLLVFGFFLVWFTKIHPLTVFDVDDWAYHFFPRRAVPLPTYWNPCRILPEILMPFCGSLAAHLVYPLMGDYLRAMTLTHGFVVSMFLTLYIYSFTRMMRRLFHLSTAGTILSSSLFLVAHFVMFRTGVVGNTYLFYCYDLTCYYYYMIPSVINASLVMWIIGNPRFSEFLSSCSPGKMGLFLLLLYLTILSNLPDSGILACYAGSVILLNALKLLKIKSSLKAFFRENYFFLGVFCVWTLSAILELCGGRAASFSNSDVSRLSGLGFNAQRLATIIFRCRWVWLAVSALIAGAALMLLLRSRGSTPEDQNFRALLQPWLVAFAAMAVYTLLLCTAVMNGSVDRTEYLFPLCFYGLLAVMLCFGYLLQKLPKTLYIVPIALCVLFCECNTLGVTYLESNYSNLSPAVCNEITQDLIDEILLADEKGLGGITLEIPVTVREDGWPLMPEFLGPRMAATLLEHGLLRREITVNTVPSMEANWRYSLPVIE